MLSVINRGILIQFFVAILGSLSALFSGIYVGNTSPLVRILSSDESPLKSGKMTADEVALMSSLVYIGSILGSLSAGFLVNSIGRKFTLLLTVVPQLIANAFVILAQEPILFLISRVIGGSIVGSAHVAVSIFTTEIAEKNLKTTLGNFFGINFNLGVFLGKTLTGLLGFYSVPIFSIVATIIFIGLCVLLPDTPEYLIFRNRPEDAEKSLRFYRGISDKDPLPESCALELEEMNNQVLAKGQKTYISIEDFKKGSTILAVIICFVLTMNMNFSGLRIMMSFTESLLEASEIPLDISSTDMIISFLQLTSAVTAILILRIIGVRTSFLCLFTVCVLAFTVSGLHYFLHESGFDLQPLTWSFLIFLGLAVVCPATIHNSITMSVLSPLLPVKIRGSVLGTLNILGLLIGFVTMQYYLHFANTFGNSIVMSLFGLWCLFALIFTYFFIPEVNKKSYSEILFDLERKIPQILRKLK